MMRNSWIVAGVACAALTACQPGTGNTPLAANAPGKATAGLAGSSAAASGTPLAATSVRLVDHDVEAPEVFQTSDKGLWDGRPSLGGVWVASSGAKNPERVIMRNPANGKFVVGGLFQRDGSLPGPKLQLSSDAADALGLVAGQPAVISVTALRRQDVGSPAPDATKPLLDANEAVKPGGKTDVAATAAAAIAKADALAGKPVVGKPVALAAAIPAGIPAVPVKPGAKPVVSVAAGALAVPVAGAVPLAGAKPVAGAVAVAGAKPVAPTVTPPTPTASGALIQIGIFSVEANAKRASDLLAKAGIVADTAAETSHGKPLWSVTTRGTSALLAQIKAAGFTDTYVLGR